MHILALGDIVGRTGRRTVRNLLPEYRRERGVDLVIANGENAAGGFGITRKVADSLFGCGIDILTMGNHMWDNKDIYDFIAEEGRIVRPANYPPGTPGQGLRRLECCGRSVCVVNLAGRVFSPVDLDCPFRCADSMLKRVGPEADIVVVDFHAEATSEKEALGRYLDGRASIIVGTHTHIQTADNRVLPGGSAYITDLGRVGATHSVLGVRYEDILEKFLTQQPVRFRVAKGPGELCGLLVELDAGGRAVTAERVRLTYDPESTG